MLVHGGFVDGSGWQGVHEHLTADGVATDDRMIPPPAQHAMAERPRRVRCPTPPPWRPSSRRPPTSSAAGPDTPPAPARGDGPGPYSRDTHEPPRFAGSRHPHDHHRRHGPALPRPRQRAGLRRPPRRPGVHLDLAAITEPRPDIDALEQAINEPGNDRWPFDLARIQLAYGSHLRRIKRTTDARRRLAEAAEIFHRLGVTPGRPARTVNYAPPASPSPRPEPAWPPSPRSNARSPCSRRQATPTRRSPPASASPRERSPPTSTRSFPSSASLPAPPSPTRQTPNDIVRTLTARRTRIRDQARRRCNQ